MLIRTYIDKNNTIIRNTQINTGRNPIAEIYYGGKESVTDYTVDIYYILTSQIYKLDIILVN